MTPASDLLARVERGLGPLGAEGPVDVLVALSGGADSVVLLHLLRFGLPAERRARLRLHVAHLDHALRPESESDADWVRGLCRAWRIPLIERRLATPPDSEAEARRVRLAFLEEVAAQVSASAILTAHHRDDQAETVLFRALRGTGVRGLAGIPLQRGLWRRPLLGVGRDELRDWGARQGLRWREDLTNHGKGNVRARMRTQVFPLLEAEVAPGARVALARLADHARDLRDESDALVGDLAAVLGCEVETDRVALPAPAFDALDPRTRRLLLRWAAERLGPALDRATSRRVTASTEDLSVGRRIDVVGGLELHRSHGHVLVVRPPPEPDAAAALVVPTDMESGRATLRLGTRAVEVRWGGAGSIEGEGIPQIHIDRESITFPLTVRGWTAGDRIRLDGGSRSVATLLSEARVPVPDRPNTPVVLDGEGTVLWLPDLARRAAHLRDGSDSLWLGIADGGD